MPLRRPRLFFFADRVKLCFGLLDEAAQLAELITREDKRGPICADAPHGEFNRARTAPAECDQPEAAAGCVNRIEAGKGVRASHLA